MLSRKCEQPADLEGIFLPFLTENTSFFLLPSLGYTGFGMFWGNALVLVMLQGIILKGGKVNAATRWLGIENGKVYVRKADIWGPDCCI